MVPESDYIKKTTVTLFAITFQKHPMFQMPQLDAEYEYEYCYVLWLCYYTIIL